MPETPNTLVPIPPKHSHPDCDEEEIFLGFFSPTVIAVLPWGKMRVGEKADPSHRLFHPVFIPEIDWFQYWRQKLMEWEKPADPAPAGHSELDDFKPPAYLQEYVRAMRTQIKAEQVGR